MTHKTVRARKALSLPMKLLSQTGSSILDYGCGSGSDCRILQSNGVNITGYDPNTPLFNTPPQPADVVTCFYVLNVIQDKEERASVVRNIINLAKERVYVAVRNDGPTLANSACVTVVPDGIINSRGSFQCTWTFKQWQEFLEPFGFTVHTKNQCWMFFLIK